MAQIIVEEHIDEEEEQEQEEEILPRKISESFY